MAVLGWFFGWDVRILSVLLLPFSALLVYAMVLHSRLPKKEREPIVFPARYILLMHPYVTCATFLFLHALLSYSAFFP